MVTYWFNLNHDTYHENSEVIEITTPVLRVPQVKHQIVDLIPAPAYHETICKENKRSDQQILEFHLTFHKISSKSKPIFTMLTRN